VILGDTPRACAVTNPLTDERITVREFISDLAGSARLEVLRSLDDQPLTASKIEDRGQVTRQTASKHLAQLTDLWPDQINQQWGI